MLPDLAMTVISRGGSRGGGARGYGPPLIGWIIMLYNVFKVSQCMGLNKKDLFFWFPIFAINSSSPPPYKIPRSAPGH